MRFLMTAAATLFAAQCNPIVVGMSMFLLHFFRLYEYSAGVSMSLIPYGALMCLYGLMNLMLYLLMMEGSYLVCRRYCGELALGQFVSEVNKAHLPFLGVMPTGFFLAVADGDALLKALALLVFVLISCVAGLYVVRELRKKKDRLPAKVVAGEEENVNGWYFRRLHVLTMLALAALLWLAPVVSIPGLLERPPITTQQCFDQIVASMEQRDEGLFLQYVDLDRVLVGLQRDIKADTVPDRRLVLEYLGQGYYQKYSDIPDQTELNAMVAWRPAGPGTERFGYSRSRLSNETVAIESLITGELIYVDLVFEKHWDRYMVVGIKRIREAKDWLRRNEMERIAADSKYKALAKEANLFGEFVTESIAAARAGANGMILRGTGYAVNKTERNLEIKQTAYYVVDSVQDKVVYVSHGLPGKSLQELNPGEKRGIVIELEVPWVIGKRVVNGNYEVRVLPEEYNKE